MNARETIELLAKSKVLFAPKSIKDLRSQYKELSEYPEFRTEAIKTYDLLFVWWMRCVSSPYHDLEDTEKLPLCIQAAYSTDAQRNSKTVEFKNGFPDNIKKAFKRMESFNLIARIENLMYTKVVRENCALMLSADVSNMDPDEQESYAKRAPGLWKLLQETALAIEGGGFGISEREDTLLSDIDGSVKDFRQGRK